MEKGLLKFAETAGRKQAQMREVLAKYKTSSKEPYLLGDP